METGLACPDPWLKWKMGTSSYLQALEPRKNPQVRGLALGRIAERRGWDVCLPAQRRKRWKKEGEQWWFHAIWLRNENRDEHGELPIGCCCMSSGIRWASRGRSWNGHGFRALYRHVMWPPPLSVFCLAEKRSLGPRMTSGHGRKFPKIKLSF